MKKFTIFVLDDDKMFCDLLLVLAKRDSFVHGIEGYELDLTVFSNMKALDGAVEHIKDNKPDLILLDYYLGPGGCLASLGVFEKLIPYCVNCTDIKIITGLYPEDARFLLAEPIIKKMGLDIIQKPFSIKELLEMIKVSIGKKENAKHC